MTDDESAVEDEREIELSSLAAIFPELIRDSNDPHSITIEIPVTSTKPFIIKSRKTPAQTTGVVSLPTPPASENEASGHKVEQNMLSARPDQQHHLSHLSPLSLRCRLEDGYPDERPPTFEMTTEPSWLPSKTIHHLVEDGKKMWEDLGKGPMLYDFIDHLQRAAEDVFDLVDPKGMLQLELGPETEVALIDFDRDAQQKEFEKGTFECGICLSKFCSSHLELLQIGRLSGRVQYAGITSLECLMVCNHILIEYANVRTIGPKKGSSCYRLPRCRHVFCQECLQDFYNSCITEGEITSVKCLDPDCGKTTGQGGVADHADTHQAEDRTLTPSELLGIPIDQERVQRYVDLKRKARLEQDKDVLYCPRKWCQGPSRYTKSRGSGVAGEEKRQWKDGDPEDEMPPPRSVVWKVKD